MAAKDVARGAGFKSLRDLAKISGVSIQTLNNWHKDKPQVFETVLIGCQHQMSPAVFLETYGGELVHDLDASSKDTDIFDLYEDYRFFVEEDGGILTRTMFIAVASEFVADLANDLL